MKLECTVYDARQGRIHVVVDAEGEDQAADEAMIAASERGCQHVTEIVVGVFE